MCKCYPTNLAFSNLLSLTSDVLTLGDEQHAYEIVRVRDEEVESEEHGPDFAARIHAVDRRAKELLRLAAVEDHESFPESPVGEDASG